MTTVDLASHPTAAVAGALVQDGLRLAISGGGTGGHIAPGLHLLGHLRDEPGRLEDLLWLSSGRTAGERMLDRLGERVGDAAVELRALSVERARGGAPGLLGLGWRLAPAVKCARALLREHRTRVVLGLGGFVTAPVVLAARSLGLPVALLEINARTGKANRVLGPLCQRVYHAWECTAGKGLGSRHRWVGPPLDPAFEPAENHAQRAATRSCLGFAADRPLLVVMGGSQGAAALNRFVAEHLGALLCAGISVLHQLGPGKLEAGLPQVEGYRPVEFIDQVPLALRAADLVLCRAGASSLAEVAGTRVPAWVVPYPHHADRHQEHNAAELGGGVRVVAEDGLDQGLAGQLIEILSPDGEAERDLMRTALAHRVPADAARTILADLEQLARGKSE